MGKEKLNVYAVHGPFKVPTVPNLKLLDQERLGSVFWDTVQNQDKRMLDKRPGCYVFVMRAGKGYTAYYIGQATKNFRQECFSLDKQLKYQCALAMSGKGTPMLFLVAYPHKQGARNKKEIGEIESFLIQQLGPRLNKQGIRPPTWGIEGVIRGGKGNLSRGAKQFRRLFRLNGI